MAKEEKGYWFSTENGTHVHAEEGESKAQAMGKKFSNFGKGKKEDKKGLKVESRSMINENQADSPKKLANKMEESHKKLHDAFKETAQEHAKNYNETDKKVIDMIKQGKTSDEIATVLEEEDTTGEFDYYNAIDYIDNLRDETELLEEDNKSQNIADQIISEEDIKSLDDLKDLTTEDVQTYMENNGFKGDAEEVKNAILSKFKSEQKSTGFFDSPTNAQIVDDYVEDAYKKVGGKGNQKNNGYKSVVWTDQSGKIKAVEPLIDGKDYKNHPNFQKGLNFGISAAAPGDYDENFNLKKKGK